MRPLSVLRSAASAAVSRACDAALRFVGSTAGALMAEYALLIGVIALVAVVGAKRLGTVMRDGANLFAWVISSS